VPTKIVLKLGFLERDFERDHLAKKATGQKWDKNGPKKSRNFSNFEGRT
jgi:hypothetical protein